MISINNKNGFTLIEMLVAVAVSSVILLMVYTVYSSNIKTVNYGKKVSSYYQQINLVLNRIDYDLTHLYWQQDIKNLQFISIFNGRSSILNFVTAEYKDYRIIAGFNMQYPVCDVHETGYYLKTMKDNSSYSLIRRTDISYNDSWAEGGFEEELLQHVVSLKFEFKYNSDWSDNWDTNNQKRIPQAVKTTIEVINPFNKTEKYQVISIPGLANG